MQHPGFLPPFLLTQLHSILPPSLFSPKPPDRGMSWFLRCASHHDCFVLPFWFPRHKIIYQNQNRMALLFSERGWEAGALWTGLCPCRVRRERLGTVEFFYLTSLMATEESPSLFRCRQVWHSSSKYWLYKNICVCVCIYMYMYIFFKGSSYL